MNGSPSQSPTISSQLSHVDCGGCGKMLPLRASDGVETDAIWLCCECRIPYVACCVEDLLEINAASVRLDERYFDVSDQAPISLAERREVALILNRVPKPVASNRRRSQRIAQSIAVPAVDLGQGFSPEGDAYQIMVANLSKEGIGIVHDGPIHAEFLAVELTPSDSDEAPLQVIVHLVQQRQLDPIYYVIGGEFMFRLGI